LPAKRFAKVGKRALLNATRKIMRELTDAELDIVGGGTLAPPRPTQGCGGEIKLVEELIVDILELLEPKQPVMRNA
jgi:hypothetical protein